MFTLVIFPGFSPELWAERAPVQDSRRVSHRRAHTIKSHCPCAGGCRNAVTLLPPLPHPPADPPASPPSWWLLLSPPFLFSSHPALNLPQNEWAVLSFPSWFNKRCSPLTPSLDSLCFVMTMTIKQWTYFSSLQGVLPPQISRISILCYEKVLPLSPVVVSNYHAAQGKSSNYLPHYSLLKEALCSRNQICWPESVSWSA